MKYKTTIKLVTEAKDKNEAMEIAGEYLSGNLATGVDMKLHTVSVRRSRQILAGAVLTVFAAGILALHLGSTKYVSPFIRNLPGDSVLQSPLKTSGSGIKSSDFKRQWQSKHAQEVLDSIKK